MLAVVLPSHALRPNIARFPWVEARAAVWPGCVATGWSYPSIVLASATRAKIERWINEAPEFRKIETEPLANDAWETKALEDDQVVFEEVEIETDEPVLSRLADWCERHTQAGPKPPVKTTGRVANVPKQRFGH